MDGILLLLPILVPILGGLAVLGIHNMKTRRLTVTLLLVFQIFVVLEVARNDTEPFVLLQLTDGARLVLQADSLGRLFANLICLIWFAVAVFAFEYMNHEGHRERFFGFYLMTLGALMGICFAGNLVTLYLFYEMMTLLSVPLVLHIGTRKAFEAAYRYLGFSVAGAGLGLLGLFVLQGYCTTDLFTPGGVLDLASGVVARVPGVFLFLVTTVVSSFMFSAERQKLAAWAGAHLPARWRAGTERLRGHLCQALCGWLRAELRLSLLIFGIVSAGLFVLGVDAPLVLGAVIAAVDALPVFGTGTVLIPWGLWCLLQGKTVLGAGLLVLYALAVTARTTLEPRLVGRQIGLHPLLALLSMYAGFQLFGVGGMILLPIASLLARQLWVYGGFSA